ncbi:hypothetical protein [Acinetobacter colistiniresistens]|uniref:hypothetical protein n=1 Tax=Acinetobacter colistiniresistens TaxID=280145 RepID=UPI001D1932AE|nr:hypothetical protein [Acinetobacter colistiniresistens]
MNIGKEREAFETATQNMSIGPYFWSSKTNEYTIVPTQRNFEVWLAAKAHESEKLEGCVVVPEAEFALLPKTITPEVEEILGMPCFKFIKAAQIYRQLGFDIPPKAEKEQSFFMFKFLHLALVHGDKCFDVFESETKAMVEAARGGNHD